MPMIENKIQITTSILALVAQLTKQNKPIPIEIQKIKENPDTCTDIELLQALQVASLPCYAGTTQGNLIKTMVGLTDDYKAIFTPYQTYILDTSALNWRDENYTILEYLEKIQLFADSEPPEGAVHQIWDAFLGMIKSVSVCPPSKDDFGANWKKICGILKIDTDESAQYEGKNSIKKLFYYFDALSYIIQSYQHKA